MPGRFEQVKNILNITCKRFEKGPKYADESLKLSVRAAIHLYACETGLGKEPLRGTCAGLPNEIHFTKGVYFPADKESLN